MERRSNDTFGSQEGIEPRFKRLAGVFGVGGEGKRRLLGRIDRLNTELERV